MYGYRCDFCKKKIYIDPGEKRICPECEEKQNLESRYQRIIANEASGQARMRMEELICK